jgi:hypothetical protein
MREGVHNLRDWWCTLYSFCGSVSWESAYKMSCSWVDVLIFMFFYLESFIWPDAILRWIRQRNSIKFCANFGKCDGDPGNDKTSLWGRKHELYSGVWMAYLVQGRLKNLEAVEDQNGKHSHHFLWYQWNCSQRIHPGMLNRVPHTTVMFYGSCLKKCKDFTVNFNNNAPSQASFFARDFFYQKHDCHPPTHPTFLCFHNWR